MRNYHGMTNTPTYHSYNDMKARCSRKSSSAYPYYGGRGIKVCERWLGENGFVNFLSDMGEKPNDKTLDRIDSEGDYTPENCRWATMSEQNYNRRLFKKNKSGYPSIYWTASNRWRSNITINGKFTYLGTFDTVEEARAAQVEKLSEHFNDNVLNSKEASTKGGER